MKRSKKQTEPVSLRYKVYYFEEFNVMVAKVWDSVTHEYVYSTCEPDWAWQECNRLNNGRN